MDPNCENFLHAELAPGAEPANRVVRTARTPAPPDEAICASPFPVSTASRAALLFLLAGATLAVPGCSEHPIVLGCEHVPGIHVVCGFQNPEDLALLDDGKTLIVSQFGKMDGSQSGNLAIFDSESETLRIAFVGGDESADGDAQDAAAQDRWGDAGCPGPPPAAFSPHGIDLAQRPDGQLQLLVVNHGGRESIEFFQITGRGAQTQLIWRGCSIPPEGAYINDVVILPGGGFLATHMMDRDSQTSEMLFGMLGWDTGWVYQWHPDGVYGKVPGSNAPFPNGIELSQDGKEMFLNVYLSGEVRRISLESGELLGVAEIQQPDNSTWGRNGKLLVASHRGSLGDQIQCDGLTEGACPMRFRIVELDPATMATRTVFENAGPPMGAGTVAVDLGDELVIGSFAGDRIIRVRPGKR